MKPIERARLLYDSSEHDFDEVLAEHLHNGIVIASPLWFLMLRAEMWHGQMTWFIECAVGNLRDLANLIAVRLPCIGFCRVKNGRKQTKIYSTERLLRLARREVRIP